MDKYADIHDQDDEERQEDHLYYLWHLQKIGLLDGSSPDSRIAPWTEYPGCRRVRTAIIDNGVFPDHPHLGQAEVARIDLAVRPFGARYDNHGSGSTTRPRTDAKTAEAYLLSQEISDKLKAEFGFTDEELDQDSDLGQLLSAVREVPVADLGVPDTATYFAAHGTACAGLLAGRPVELEHTAGDDSASMALRDVPYFGVDPRAQIISITTPYDFEVRPIILALLFAVDNGADVILMPRGLNDVGAALPGDAPSDNPRATRLDDNQALRRDTDLFKRVLSRVSLKIPTIFAAGNDGTDNLSFPASLVGEIPSLIVVGAHNHKGHVSSYTSGSYRNGITIYAPSDDGEIVDGALLRYDTRTYRGARLSLSEHTGELKNLYSRFGVLSIDLPGRFGFSEGFDGEDDTEATEPDGPGGGSTGAGDGEARSSRPALYTVFGGTSAASSIVAGVASLMQRAAYAEARKPLTGQQVKNRLEEAQRIVDETPSGVQVSEIDAMALYNGAKSRPGGGGI